MFISALTEPAFFVAAFAIGLGAGTTDLSVLSTGYSVTLSRVAALAALFMVAIIETSRIPIDNQETHLELTMVHEAMVLEYSGRSLALLQLAAHIKQVILFSILSTVVFRIVPLPGLSLSSIIVFLGIFTRENSRDLFFHFVN